MDIQLHQFTFEFYPIISYTALWYPSRLFQVSQYGFVICNSSNVIVRGMPRISDVGEMSFCLFLDMMYGHRSKIHFVKYNLSASFVTMPSFYKEISNSHQKVWVITFSLYNEMIFMFITKLLFRKLKIFCYEFLNKKFTRFGNTSLLACYVFGKE